MTEENKLGLEIIIPLILSPMLSALFSYLAVYLHFNRQKKFDEFPTIDIVVDAQHDWNDGRASDSFTITPKKTSNEYVTHAEIWFSMYYLPSKVFYVGDKSESLRRKIKRFIHYFRKEYPKYFISGVKLYHGKKYESFFDFNSEINHGFYITLPELTELNETDLGKFQAFIWELELSVGINYYNRFGKKSTLHKKYPIVYWKDRDKGTRLTCGFPTHFQLH